MDAYTKGTWLDHHYLSHNETRNSPALGFPRSEDVLYYMLGKYTGCSCAAGGVSVFRAPDGVSGYFRLSGAVLYTLPG